MFARLSFQKYPLFRLSLALTLGICVAEAHSSLLKDYLWMAGTLMGLSMGVMGIAFFSKRFSSKLFFGGATFFTLFIIGVLRYGLYDRSLQYSWPAEKETYVARVTDYPKERPKSYQIPLEILAVHDSAAWRRVGKNIYAYFQQSSSIEEVPLGSLVILNAKVEVPTTFSDSLSFDYARYLRHRGVVGTAYVSASSWKLMGNTPLSLKEKARRWQQQLQKQYEQLNWGDEELAVLAALTLGDKRLLSPSLRNTYSSAGASHVLALSGMHIGVIYMLLAWVMGGRRNRYGRKWIKEILILLLLWIFAFVVGLSPSVVRSVVMCTLFGVGRCAHRNSSPLNALAFAALLMLLVAPESLFDVGFQLSFAAMLSILLMQQNGFTIQLVKGCSFLRPVVGVLGVSLAAQAGTFPLALHYFSTFPTYFLVTNLLIFPLLYGILWVALAWWACMAVPSAQNFVGECLRWIIHATNGCLEQIGQLPGAVLTVANFSWVQVMLTYGILVFGLLFFGKRWPRGLVYCFICVFLLLLSFALPRWI